MGKVQYSILQTVQKPREQTCTSEELFFHRLEDHECYDGYFNILSCKKWNRYTQIRHISLAISGEGSFVITLYSENGALGTTSSEAMGKEFLLELPDLDKQAFLWFTFRPLSDDARLVKACYVTTQEPLRQIRLAADICTFRREAYVKRNLDLLKSEILENADSPLFGKLDIFLVDNGRTLSKKEIETEEIFLFPNKNAGGSGGFTRGILEIYRCRKKGYTHMIFLDDDAVLMPDAFIRCFALLSFMKEEYRQSCVAGALLDEEEPYLQQEAGAYYRDGVPAAARAGVDLRSREAVCKNEELENVEYAGWWWACFPLTVVRPDNLPLPFFLHFDDMEYGLRNGGEIIYLNGICVWHAAPQKRRPQTNVFYHIRNRMVTDAIRGTDDSLKEILFYCLNEIAYNTLRYQYGAADMVLQAVKDFVGGPVHFGRVDPEARNDQIRALADPFYTPEQLVDDTKVQAQIREYCKKTIDPEWKRPLISKKKYIATLNGWLLPVRKDNPQMVVCCDIFQPDMRELYRAKRALLIDPYTGKGAWVEKSWHGAWHSLQCMTKVSWILLIGYRRSAKKFRRQQKYLTGSRFWMKYLGIHRSTQIDT